MYSYTRQAADVLPLDNAGKMGVVLRASRIIFTSGKDAVASWNECRTKKSDAALSAWLLAMHDILQQMFFIAKALRMDLTGFRVALADSSEIEERAASGALTFEELPSSSIGKISYSMRDILVSTRELISGAHDMQGADLEAMPLELTIFGSDVSIILGAFVMIFKQLKGSYKGVLKARDEALRFFEILTDAPKNNADVETEYAPMSLMASIKKATALTRRNPKAGWLLLGTIEQRLSEPTPWSGRGGF